MGKLVLRFLLVLVALVLLLAVILVVFLTLTEPRPEDVEPAELVPGPEPAALEPDSGLRLVSFNIGYAGLGADSDFFMDGGKDVRPADETVIARNLSSIMSTIQGMEADYLLFQEVDRPSHRSYGTDMPELLAEGAGMGGTYAWNYRCAFVPFPLPPIGQIDSGVLTLSRFGLYAADGSRGGERHALPCPFAWPVRTANLKRCLLVTRTPVRGTGRELVVINFHLEAYDDGQGKLDQTRVLMSLLEAEYAKGNYVVAGGDFNCMLPGTTERWPILDADTWIPGTLSEADVPAGFSLHYDPDTPSCRLLDRPWDGENQTYGIDGFLVSDNLTVTSVRALDLDFQYADHNPVVLELRLG